MSYVLATRIGGLVDCGLSQHAAGCTRSTHAGAAKSRGSTT